MGWRSAALGGGLALLVLLLLTSGPHAGGGSSGTARPGEAGDPDPDPWFCGGTGTGPGAGAGGATDAPAVGDPRGETPDPAAGGERPPGAPSADLYCLPLFAVPGLEGPEGTAQLAPAVSPFGVPLTPEGRFRYRVSLRLEGLPEPRQLGDFRAYVAWAADPTLRPVVRLGRVGNGTHRLGTVALNKFLVLVTAEGRADARAPEGKVVLRARSPSMRLQPHDLPYGFMGGRPPERAPPGGAAPVDTAGARAAGDTAGRGGRTRRWTAPPMHPGVQMVPLLRSVLPSTPPFLPGPGDGAPEGGASAGTPADSAGAAPGRPAGTAAASLPQARPREVVRLEDGDTLRLAARRVRRTVGGRTFVMYGFNTQYPGPLIRVPRGAEIVVPFRNRIGLPTTIHWHGIRIENRFDGVPGVTQEPVPPGGSFTYRVRFPDAGLYWYHPHVREDVQQDLGLYGNMLVEPEGLRRDPAAGEYSYGGHFGPVDREEVLMLDDLLLAGDALVPYGREVNTHALMGRFGNTFLVNGEPGYRLTVERGEVVRFYLTNVAGTRTFNLSFGDLPVKLVASDLSRFEREVRTPNVVVGPAQRYVAEVRFEEAGRVPLLNRVQAIDHVYGNFFLETDTLGIVRVRPREGGGTPTRGAGGDSASASSDRGGRASGPAPAFDSLRAHPEVIRGIERYRAAFDGPVDRRLHLDMESEGLPFPVGPLMRKDSVYFHPVEMSGTMPRMNWAATSREVRWILRDPDTGRENMEVDWRFETGEVVKLRLRNLRHSPHAMQHPIHIHGQRFLVLSRNGRRNHNLVWKDTTILPVGTTATLLLELTNPGEWMIHCHVSEHLNSGMRMTFTVEETGPGAGARPDPPDPDEPRRP